MPNIFTPPVAIQRARSTAWGLPSAKNKRKKLKIEEDASRREERDADALADAKTQTKGNPEYTAVVTPDERTQRRVAGQPLDQKPPIFPFPHAEDPSTQSRAVREALLKPEKGAEASKMSDSSQSLHMQHLAALTAIVHRSLLREDFSRASRALGLMFREEAVSENAASRSQGFMGIAAEVLLRNGCPKDPTPEFVPAFLPFTQEGFEKTKRFYERLIVRHPYHKSWPNAVNAVDFYLAMFNLWIYVAHAESATKSGTDEDDENDVGTSKKVRGLEQANQIAYRLDTCMATVPYMDEPELIRLRAMVALWQADLHEDCAYMVKNHEPQVSDALPGQNGLSRPSEEGQTSGQSEHLREARIARDKAQEYLSKLEGQATSDGG